MNKTISSFVASVVLVAGLYPAQFAISAPNVAYLDNLPETAGVYDVAGKPDLKLRVFVHHGKADKTDAAKPAKPQPATPALVCQPVVSIDPDSAAVAAPAGWRLPSSWTYRVNTASVPSTVGAAGASALIANGYGVWSGAVSGKVVFSRGTDTTMTAAKRDGQNIVAWGRASSSALAVTYTWYNQTTGLAVEIDTIFNKSFKWYWSDPSLWPSGEQCAYQGAYDAQDIFTHELGHTVGLDDHYTADYANNTMYGYGSTGETKKNTLTTGDILGASALY